MVKFFFFVFAITIIIGSNADVEVDRALDWLLTRCNQIEHFIGPVQIQIQSRKESLTRDAGRVRNILNEECVKAIEKNNYRINQLLKEKLQTIAELEKSMFDTMKYVKDVKKNNEREIMQHKREILETCSAKQDEMIAKVNSAKRLNIRFVTDLATPPEEFVVIQNCYKQAGY